MSWEGEIFGVGMFEALAGKYPGQLTACATMEWFNVHVCEEFGHGAGVHVSLEEAEKLGREGPWFKSMWPSSADWTTRPGQP
jgi:hypothetical protein